MQVFAAERIIVTAVQSVNMRCCIGYPILLVSQQCYLDTSILLESQRLQQCYLNGASIQLESQQCYLNATSILLESQQCYRDATLITAMLP